MKKVLFFGDSITSAENNHFRGFPEYLYEISSVNFGVSGSTIGNYSLYPVKDNDLVSLLYKETDSIKRADIIFLEYGINDISALICGNVTANKIYLALIKAVDYIKQVNNQIEIYFITLVDADIKRFAKSQVKYLTSDYLACLSLDLQEKSWADAYSEFKKVVTKLLPTVFLTESGLLDKHIDSDGIHPNAYGYEVIADELCKQLFY